MREPERDSGRLRDIIQAADNILSFTEGRSREELLSDKLRYYAVEQHYKNEARISSWIRNNTSPNTMANSFSRCSLTKETD